MGVDSVEVGGRLPAREGRVRLVVEEQRHFRRELAVATAMNDPGLLACIVDADVFQEGMEDGVSGGRRDYLDVLGRHCED